MRVLLLLAYVANLALDVASWLLHPGSVAVHFGVGGQADGWGSSAGQAAFLAGLQTVFFIVFRFGPRWMVRIPPRWINLPNKEYWLAPARRERCAEMLEASMHRFGAILFLFFFCTGALALQAQARTPPHLDEGLFLTALGLFLACTGAWLVAFVRRFRLPPT